MVDLLEYFLQVLGLDALHVRLELVLLLDAQILNLLGRWLGSGGRLVLLIRICLLIGTKRLCHLRNLLFAFSLEMLVNGVLHRVNSFLEARIPVVLHCIVRSAHQFL